jgi:hypothetical protein
VNLLKNCTLFNGLQVFKENSGKIFDTASQMLKMRLSLG